MIPCEDCRPALPHSPPLTWQLLENTTNLNFGALFAALLNLAGSKQRPSTDDGRLWAPSCCHRGHHTVSRPCNRCGTAVSCSRCSLTPAHRGPRLVRRTDCLPPVHGEKQQCRMRVA